MVNTMRYVILENNIIVNAAVADEPLGENWIASDQGNIGDQYLNGEFIKPAIDQTLISGIARHDRNVRLAASDWTQLSDAPVNKVLWATYRQALRDVPQQAGFPTSIEWPVAP